MKLTSLGSLTANEDVIAYGSVVKGNEAINTGEVAGDRVLPQSTDHIILNWNLFIRKFSRQLELLIGLLQ